MSLPAWPSLILLPQSEPLRCHQLVCSRYLAIHLNSSGPTYFTLRVAGKGCILSNSCPTTWNQAIRGLSSPNQAITAWNTTLKRWLMLCWGILPKHMWHVINSYTLWGWRAVSCLNQLYESSSPKQKPDSPSTSPRDVFGGHSVFYSKSLASATRTAKRNTF